MQTIQQRNPTEQQIEKAILMEAVAGSDAGIAFLQWLCQLTGWNRPTMNNEESAQRDIWIRIRKFIPVEKLPLIELEELRREQQLIKGLIQAEMSDEQSPANF